MGLPREKGATDVLKVLTDEFQGDGEGLTMYQLAVRAGLTYGQVQYAMPLVRIKAMKAGIARIHEQHGNTRIYRIPPDAIRGMRYAEWMVKGMLSRMTMCRIDLEGLAKQFPDCHDLLIMVAQLDVQVAGQERLLESIRGFVATP